jgi:adenosylmethionine-8-amino-7-oxononanoate aminotransferase
MPSEYSKMTPEQLDKHREYHREYQKKNREKIRIQQREWYLKNKSAKKKKREKRESRTLTRAENRNDIRAIMTKRPTVNMRDTMHLSVEKFIEAANKYCDEKKL